MRASGSLSQYHPANRSRFAELERVPAEFIAFVEKHPVQYGTWVKAEKAFRKKDFG